MAPRGKRNEPAADDAVLGDELEDQEGAALSALMDLAELGDDELGFITLSKITKDHPRGAYCRRYEPGEFSLEVVRDEYGAGKYLARAHKPNNAIRLVKRFDVFGPDVPPPAAAPASAPPPGQDFNSQLILALIGRQKDPMEIAAGIAQSMIGAMQPLLAAKASGGADPTQVIDAWRRGYEQGREDGQDTAKELPAWAPLVPGLAKVLEALPSGQGAGQRTTPAPEGTSAMPEWAKRIAPAIAPLVDRANQGSDPGLYAGVLEDQYPQVVDWITSNWPSAEAAAVAMFAAFPTITPGVQPWFKQVLEDLFRSDDSDGSDGLDGLDGSGHSAGPQPVS